MAGGFRPVQDLSGHSYTGKIFSYFVPASHATLLAVGDLVTQAGDADVVTSLATAVASTAANPLTGVIIAIDFNVSNLEQKGLPAGIAGVIKVAIDPDILVEAEISNGSLATTNVGQNADIVATAATLSGGLVNSNMTVDAGTFTGSTAQMRLVRLKDGAVGSGVTAIFRINESTIKSTVGV